MIARLRSAWKALRGAPLHPYYLPTVDLSKMKGPVAIETRRGWVEFTLPGSQPPRPEWWEPTADLPPVFDRIEPQTPVRGLRSFDKRPDV